MKKTLLLQVLMFISVSIIAQPANNECSGATTITLVANNWATTNGTVLNATQTQPPPNNTCSDYSSYRVKDVWFKFQPLVPTATIEVIPSSGLDPGVEVFSGNCSNLVSESCIDRAGGRGRTEIVPLNTLNANNIYYVRVYPYYATAAGADPTTFTFTIRIYSAGANTSSINFSSTSLDFGQIQVGSGNASTRMLSISNPGTAALNISTIRYPSCYSGSINNLLIYPNETENMTITFRPTSLGTCNGNLIFTSNASGSPHQVQLTGEGVSTPRANIAVTPNNLSLTATQNSSPNPTESFTISNTGTATLNVTSISTDLPNIYSFNVTPPLSIPVGGTPRTVTMTMRTADLGAHGTTVSIVSNGGNESINVSGTVVENSNFISGVVKNVTRVVGSGIGLKVDEPIGSGKTVELYNSSGTRIGSTLTNADGYFKFSNAVNNAKIKILADGGSRTVSKDNLSVSSNTILFMPKELDQKINSILADLKKIKINLTAYNVVAEGQGYNTDNATAVLNNYKTINNNFQEVSVVMGRLHDLLTMLEGYKRHSIEITQENLRGLFEICGYLGGLQKIYLAVRAIVTANRNAAFTAVLLDVMDNSILYSMEKIKSWAIDCFIEAFGNLTADRGKMLAWMNYIMEDTKSLVDGNPFDMNLLKYPVLNYGSKYILNTFYTEKHQPQVNYVLQRCSNPNNLFQTTLPTLHSGLLQSNTNWDIATINKVRDVQILYDISQLSSKVNDVVVVANAFPPTAVAATAVRSVLTGVGLTSAGIAQYKGWKFFIDISKATNTDPVFWTRSPTPANQRHESALLLSSLAELDSLTTVYTGYLDSLITDVDYSKDFLVLQKLKRLKTIHQRFEQSLFDNSQLLLAVVPQAIQQDSTFENLYFYQLVDPIFKRAQERIALYFNIVNYMTDTTITSNANDLVVFGREVIRSHQALPITFLQFSNRLSTFTAPAAPVIYEVKAPIQMAYGSTFPVKIYLKNYGAVNSNRLYLKTIGHGNFSVSQDSMFIGTLLVNQKDSTVIQITAPLTDTIGGFEFVIVDAEKNSYGTAISIKAGQSTITGTKEPIWTEKRQALKLNLAPNPANDEVQLTYDLPESAAIQLNVMDMQGKMVKNVLTEKQIAGSQALKFLCGDLPSGNYMILLSSQKYFATSQFVINH